MPPEGFLPLVDARDHLEPRTLRLGSGSLRVDAHRVQDLRSIAPLKGRMKHPPPFHFAEGLDLRDQLGPFLPRQAMQIGR